MKWRTWLAALTSQPASLSWRRPCRSRDRVFLRAYSFDAPPVLEALEAACARGAACSLVSDASQCAKTKHQWQSLKRVAAAGVNVRLAAGHSVRDAYVADGRGAAVGAGLKGLHHSKALLVVSETTADLIVGSLNCGRRAPRPTPRADCSGCDRQRPFWAFDPDPLGACGRSLRGTVRSLRQDSCAAIAESLQALCSALICGQ
ncbi:unnamed protein product, partial [Symbiodinium microadriaticum]